MVVSINGATPKSSIYRWNFPWKKPSINGGTTVYGNLHIYGNRRKELLASEKFQMQMLQQIKQIGTLGAFSMITPKCLWTVLPMRLVGCKHLSKNIRLSANMKVEGWKARMTRFVEFDPRILSVWVGIWHSQVWPKAIVVDEYTLQTPDLLGGLWFKGQREKVWKIGRWSSHRSAPKKISESND